MSTRIFNSSKICTKLLVILILALACLTIFVINTGKATAAMESGPLTKLDVKIVVNKVAATDTGPFANNKSCIDHWGLGCGYADFYPMATIDGEARKLRPNDTPFPIDLIWPDDEFEDEDVIFPGDKWPLEGRADFETNFCNKVVVDSGQLGGKGGCTVLELSIFDNDWDFISDDDLIDINDLSVGDNGGANKGLRFEVYWNNEITSLSNITDSFVVSFQGCDIDESDEEIGDSGFFVRPMEHTNSDEPTAKPRFKSPEFRCIGNQGDRAGIRLHIEVAMTGDPLYKPNEVWRNLILPDQIFPDSLSTFKIRNAVVGAIGNARDINDENVVMTTEMWVSEPDGDFPSEAHTVCFTEGANKAGYTNSPHKDFISLPNAWVLNELEDGTYTIEQKRDSRFLHQDGAEHVVTGTDSSAANKEWTLIESLDGSYNIVNVSTGQFLDAYTKEDDDTPWDVVTRPEQNDDSQKWVVTELDDGSVTIRQVESGRFLDAYESVDLDFNVVTREKDYNGLVCEIEVGPFEDNPGAISFGAISYDVNGFAIDPAEPRTISFENEDWDYEEGPMPLNIGRSPYQAIDIIFAPESSDFSPACEITGNTGIGVLDDLIIPLLKDLNDAENEVPSDELIPDDIVSQIEVGWGFIGTQDIDCSASTYDTSLIREEIQLTLENSFFAAQQWEGMAYSDVLMQHRDQLNFWYTEKPVHVAGDKMFHVLDDTWAHGPSDSITATGHGFGDVVFVVRKTHLRASAHPIHRTVSHPVRDDAGEPLWERFLTLNHELGHNPFGLTDLYDTTCDETRTFDSDVNEGEDNSEVLKAAQTAPGCQQTLYYQRSQFPNVYADIEDWKNVTEILGYVGEGYESLGIAEVLLDEWGFGDTVPGCIFRHSALNSEGFPTPPGLKRIRSNLGTPLFTGCDEINNNDDPVAGFLGNEPPDWWRAEPLESAMGHHRHSSDWLPAYRKWQTAVGLPVTPQRDNAWQYGPASKERITHIFESLCPDDC